MRTCNIITSAFFWQMRKFHSSIGKSSSAALAGNRAAQCEINPRPNWRDSLERKLEGHIPGENDKACIYRVPINMLDVEPKAYKPNIISIGPYHRGVERLKAMEDVKWKLSQSLFDPRRPNRVRLGPVIDALEDLEEEARSHYSEKIDLSRDEFVEMMLRDGCFIIQLFRELSRSEFKDVSPFVKRWMLPVLRRDLIMMENQLPIFVLNKLFQLTSSESSEESCSSLRTLAIGFFKPLLQGDLDVASTPGPDHALMVEGKHFVHLFRSSILPRTALHDHQAQEEKLNGVDSDTMLSITELIKAGVKVKVGRNCRPLDVRSERRALVIPPLHINDYRGTLLRNLVAFEQCHRPCKPQVTAYLFFFDGLINSAEDVAFLHRKGVIDHSLGSNKQVAQLVNSLCKELVPDGNESYLRKVVQDSNFYRSTAYAKFRSQMVHHYFSSVTVTMSTIAACIALYLTLIQTGCDVRSLDSSVKTNFLVHMRDAIFLPFFAALSMIHEFIAACIALYLTLIQTVCGLRSLDSSAKTNFLVHLQYTIFLPFFAASSSPGSSSDSSDEAMNPDQMI